MPSCACDTILFAGLDDEQLDHIAAAGEVYSLQRNVVLFEEGAEPHEFYLVLAGRIAIAQESEDGRESLLALMGPGELFGELGFLDGQDRSAQARALEESEVLVVPYAELRLLYENHPTALWSAVQLLARRLRATDRALSDTVFLDVWCRTAKLGLDGWFNKAPSAESSRDSLLRVPLTQEELASMVGASRERVNKAIHAGHEFVRLGWITHAAPASCTSLASEGSLAFSPARQSRTGATSLRTNW